MISQASVKLPRNASKYAPFHQVPQKPWWGHRAKKKINENYLEVQRDYLVTNQMTQNF